MLSRLLIAMTLLFGGAASALAEEPECFSDWSEAASIVRHQKLASSKHVRELAKKKAPGDLVRMTLCREQGKYTYRLLIVEAGGRVRNVTVDAEKPFER
jgi:uncharacterized membrane protein YkoI